MVERVFAGYFAERAVPYRHELSPAETEILRYLAHGLNCNDIARLRRSQPATVHKQVKTLRAKLAAKTIAHAVGIALRHGLID